MRLINRSKDRKAQRRKVNAENKFLRSLRSDEEQLALIATRRGQSKRETLRLQQRIKES